MEHDTLIQLLKFATALGMSSAALFGLIKVYLHGRAKVGHNLLDREEKIERQREAAQKEREDAVNTHVRLLKDSVITLSNEVKCAKEIQAQQDKDIALLNKTVRDLRDTVGSLSNRIRDFLASQVDANNQRTIVRTRKG